MLVPKKAVKFVDVTDTVATNLSISFHRHRKYTKNYRSHCYPNSRASGRAHTCHCKQAVQRLITSVKANLELFTSAKSTSLSRDISKQAARICLLQPIWNTAPPHLSSSFCAVFRSPSASLLLHRPTNAAVFLPFQSVSHRSFLPQAPLTDAQPEPTALLTNKNRRWFQRTDSKQ